MNNNPLKKLESLGQSIWLDYIRRDLITNGELQKLIDEDVLRGMTSNPAIFEKAIAESNLYDADIQKMALKGKNVNAIYESISQQDVQRAADVFRPLYEKTSGDDGYVSLEVNPHLAHKNKGTIQEGRRLWSLLNRPNVFIKVPATTEGLVAIRQLISDGINVNVTLLFSLNRYRAVAEAYIEGLEARLAKRKTIDQISSVASFFLSRIDTLIDPQLEKIMEAEGIKSEMAKEAHGEVAISSARLAYQIYREVFGSERFKRLEGKGAHAQRLLWASTSNKNPAYSDVKYIEALIGANTVNTVPPPTIDAYRDHGDPKLSIELYVSQAMRIMASLPKIGIEIDQMTQQLEDEGVSKFKEPFDKLMDAIGRKSSI
ncbi:MAG: transaldolase [Prolixibacteraceae bacterium]|jgi:transaldolase